MTVAQGDGKPDIAFSSDGTLKSVELKIMNLRPDGRSNQDLIWEQVNFHNFGVSSQKKILQHMVVIT